MKSLRGIMVVVALVLFGAVACAPFRGGEQPGYWQKITDQVRK